MKVKSIKKVDYKSKRYDIGVKDNNNLFANNILVHNCQNLESQLPGMISGVPVYVTEKIDGSSITIYCVKEDLELDKSNYKFGVCSRNLELKLEFENENGEMIPSESRFVNTVREMGIEEKMIAWCLKKDKDLVIQGELIGEGVQGNLKVMK